MMGSEDPTDRAEHVREQAAAWFARLEAPDGDHDRAAFEAWCAESQDHAEAYNRISRRWDRTAFLGGTEVAQAYRRDRRRAMLKRTIAVAAAIVVLGLLGVMALAKHIAGPAIQVAATDATLRSAVGEIRVLRLADGSEVTLDTNSAVEVSFSAGRRALRLLRGRARFAVAHEKARPFQVEAGSGLVIAHGTIFDVALLGNETRVQLLQGAVEVRGRATPNRAGRHLTPNHALAIRDEAGAERISPEPIEEARWPSGMLSFDQTTLEDAAREMNRYNQMQLRVQPQVANLRLTGAFRSTDPQGFGEAAAAALHLTLDRRRAGVLLLRPRT